MTPRTNLDAALERYIDAEANRLAEETLARMLAELGTDGAEGRFLGGMRLLSGRMTCLSGAPPVS